MENAMNVVRSASGLSEMELLDQLARDNISPAKYKEELKSQILATKLTLDLVKSEYSSLDAALLEYFKRHASEFSSQGWVRLFHVGVADRAQAEKIAELVKGGSDFPAAAEKITAQPPTDTGKLMSGDLSAEVLSAISGLQAGQTSAPTEIGGNLLLFHLAEKGGGPPSFEEAKESVYKRFMGGGMREVMENWLSVRR
ncbi:peptidyl-prolyl cis-trans isomerase, partial [bacterium]